MLVTILTDASWCPKTGASGYGYWIASNRGKRPGGSKMRRASSSTHAEMMAIANGLTVALKAGLIEPGDEVLVQSDSTEAIACLTGKRMQYESFTGELAEVRGYVLEFSRQNNLRLTYRHVKGHSSRPEARYRANNHCDERAKKFMKQARHELRTEAGGKREAVPQD